MRKRSKNIEDEKYLTGEQIYEKCCCNRNTSGIGLAITRRWQIQDIQYMEQEEILKSSIQ